MVKLFRKKVSSKRRIRGGGDRESDVEEMKNALRNMAPINENAEEQEAAKKIQKIARGRATRKAAKKAKTNKAATKIQKIARGRATRKNINARSFSDGEDSQGNKKRTTFKKKLREGVNAAKDRQCPICIEEIREGDTAIECIETEATKKEREEKSRKAGKKEPEPPIRHRFHADCIKPWCEAASNDIDIDENGNLLTKCPFCGDKAYITCPGDASYTRRRREVNAEIHRRERADAHFAEARRLQALEDGIDPARREEREEQEYQAFLAEQRAREAREADEKRRIGIIENIFKERLDNWEDRFKYHYDHMSRPEVTDEIETELRTLIYDEFEIEYIEPRGNQRFRNVNSVMDLDDNVGVRDFTNKLRDITSTILNNIAAKAIPEILIPEMQKKYDAVAQGRTEEELKRVMNDAGEREDYEEYRKIRDTIYLGRDLNRIRANPDRNLDEWWKWQNSVKLKEALEAIEEEYGDFIIFGNPQSTDQPTIAGLAYRNMYDHEIYNIFGINSRDIDRNSVWDIDNVVFPETTYAEMFTADITDDNVTYPFFRSFNPIITKQEREEIVKNIGGHTVNISYNGIHGDLVDMNKENVSSVFLTKLGNVGERDIVDVIWAIYGPGGVYVNNTGNTPLLRSREEVNSMDSDISDISRESNSSSGNSSSSGSSNSGRSKRRRSGSNKRSRKSGRKSGRS